MDIVTNQITTVIFTCAVVSFLVGIYYERTRTRWSRRAWKSRKGRTSNMRPFTRGAGLDAIVPVESGQPPISDAAEQLRIVMAASYSKQRILNKTEARVFAAIEDALQKAQVGWRLMAQVNLGEMLRSDDPRAFAAINSKRVDMLVVSAGHQPIAAIEYQGGGHHQGTSAARDAVKKEALRKAGVSYYEVTPADGPEDVHRIITRMAQVEKSE